MTLEEFMKMQEEAHVITTLVHITELMEEHGVCNILYDLHTLSQDNAVRDELETVIDTLIVKH